MTKMRIGKKKSTREEIGARNIDALGVETYGNEYLSYFLVHLDRVQIQTASAREFLFILRFRNYNPETNEVQTGISRMTKLLKDAGFSYRQASKEDIKRLYAVYFVQNITQVYFDDYDGERFVKGDEYR